MTDKMKQLVASDRDMMFQVFSRRYEGRTFDSIAEELGVSSGGLRNYMSKNGVWINDWIDYRNLRDGEIKEEISAKLRTSVWAAHAVLIKSMALATKPKASPAMIATAQRAAIDLLDRVTGKAIQPIEGRYSDETHDLLKEIAEGIKNANRSRQPNNAGSPDRLGIPADTGKKPS